MENIQVVTLTPEEWQLYKRIRVESLLMEPQAFGSSYSEVIQRPDSHWQQRLIEARVGKKSWLLFAKENERIIGMIGAYCPEENDVVEIISVYVTREKRRCGVASAMMEAILEEVGKGGSVRKAVLTVNADQTAAIALYRQFGFEIAGEKTGVLGDGNSYPGYIMEKVLGQAYKEPVMPVGGNSS
jgi:ribosomal protein S18 acetylase RimI-like enzyme